MATVIGLVIGMLAGGLLFGGGSAMTFGGLIGAVVGFIVTSRRERVRSLRPDAMGQSAQLPGSSAVESALADRMSTLERRVADLERSLSPGASNVDSAVETVVACRAAGG